jgi:hypothetical protein
MDLKTQIYIGIMFIIIGLFLILLIKNLSDIKNKNDNKTISKLNTTSVFWREQSNNGKWHDFVIITSDNDITFFIDGSIVSKYVNNQKSIGKIEKIRFEEGRAWTPEEVKEIYIKGIKEYKLEKELEEEHKLKCNCFCSSKYNNNNVIPLNRRDFPSNAQLKFADKFDFKIEEFKIIHDRVINENLNVNELF